MAHTIPCTALKPGTFINVEGTVEFCRLTRFLEPEELKKLQQTRQFTPDKPFTTITLGDVRILPANPNALSKEELYVQESFYTSSKNPGAHYSIDNKSPNFPRFYQVKVNDDGSIDNTKVSEVPAKAELAKGLKVVLVLRVFKPKNYPNCGIGLDSVIAQEPIRYYNGGNAISHLAQMGITVENELSDDQRNTAAKQATQAPVPSVEPANDFNAQPVSAPVGNPYASAAQEAAQPATASMPEPTPVANTPAPQPQNQAQADTWNCPNCNAVSSGKFCNECGTPKPAPVAETPAPVQNDNWTCTGCGAINTGKFCNSCGTPKPAEGPAMGTPIGNGNPYATNDTLANTQTGIRFDPNDNNRNY